MKEKWDILIVLDACRYDIYSQLYTEYFEGDLERVISPASSTIEWCQKVFRAKHDDVVYISANPYINSKVQINGFKATEFFYKIVDVWGWGWDDELGTVHPEMVNKAARQAKRAYPKKRLIIHYLQPHAPYIGGKSHLAGFPIPKPGGYVPLRGLQKSHDAKIPFLKTWSKFLGNAIVKLVSSIARYCSFGDRVDWKIRQWLGMSPAGPMDAMRRSVGITGLRRAYIENLRLVLSYVRTLVKTLEGKIIITTDHGERLGENGHFGHVSGSTDPLLRMIPWFQLRKTIDH